MKLNYDRKSKDPTYFIQRGVRNGRKVTTINVKRIGKHSELLAITLDPLAYAKEQVEKFNEEYKAGKIKIRYEVDFDEKLEHSNDLVSLSTSRNVGYFFLNKIYNDLNLNEFFAKVKKGAHFQFDSSEINRFLTFDRILNPHSKKWTQEHINTYYFEEPKTIEYQHILRHLDVLSENYDQYLEHLFVHSNKIVKRNTSICYFDCTNYYFEKEHEDEDYTDPYTGEVMTGLCQYGYGKDHKPNPIVQMGLFMDGNGIPISMCINPGNSNEQVCAVPLEKKIIRMFGNDSLIYCADGGLGSYQIRDYNSKGNRAFVVTQSVKKLSDILQEAVFSDCDYAFLSTGKPASIKQMKEFDPSDENNLELYNDKIFKVIEANHPIDCGLYDEKTYKNGRTVKVKAKTVLRQHLIITFSRKMMEYQRAIRARQIERAKKLIKIRNTDQYKKGPNDISRLIKRISRGKNGEKAIDKYEIDQDIINQEEKYDGFYAVATNLDDSPVEILKISEKRNKIEECFRITKTNLKSRPVYLSLRNHIVAHFLSCYTALLVYRLLEVKLDRYGKHFTTDNILETLRNLNVVNNHDLFYSAIYSSSEVCTNLCGAFKLGLDKKYYRATTLNKMLQKFSSVIQ